MIDIWNGICFSDKAFLNSFFSSLFYSIRLMYSRGSDLKCFFFLLRFFLLLSTVTKATKKE